MSGRGRGYSNFKPASEPSSWNKGAAIPPPPSCQVNSRGFSTLSSIHQRENAINDTYFETIKKRNRTEDEYFDEEDEPLPYIPGPGSPSYKGGRDKELDSDEDDPLDQFMHAVEQQVLKESIEPKVKTESNKAIRADIEDEDNEEAYYRFVAENPDFGKDIDEDDDIEYDVDGNPIFSKRSKWIDPLPPIDHSAIEYKPFEKNFYEQHSDIQALSDEQVNNLMKTLGITVSGACPPKPVSSFGHMGFPEIIMKSIRKSEFTQPTPIQAQGIPIVLSGRDVIGIAKTGSGKTATYLWPMLIHIADQPPLKPGEGPIGLILCPTRELALQIYTEAKKFGKVFNFSVCCCYGGGNKYEQSQALEKGADIVVATPGRMIDMVKIKATELSRVTYLVLDEADRMFDMGFEIQVNSICAHVRLDRQTLLFSATFRKKVEKLARMALKDPIRVVQGEIGVAQEDVQQHILIMDLGGHKWNWLLMNLVEFTSAGSVLIFVTKKANAEELCNNLKLKEINALLMHGDMDQIERNKVIVAFRKKEIDILVATDVAARGLDIPHIRTVINFDIARDIDTHTHRIGRTGRSGIKGDAYTLITEKDKEFAGHLVRNLEGVGQEVPNDLMNLAMQSSWFRKSRFKGGKGKSALAIGKTRGLGFKESSGAGGGVVGVGGIVPSASNSMSSSTGPAANRLSAMRDAFKASYTSHFIASNENPIIQPNPQETIVPPIQSQSTQETEDSSSNKRKRSRWN